MITELPRSASLTSMSIFPNPADDVLNMNLVFGTPQEATITIVNMAGQVLNTINTGVTTNYNNAIDISALPAGVYMARVASGNQSTIRNFIVE